MNLGTTIRRGAAWLLAGSLSQRALDFAIGILLARLLLPEDFGTVAIVYAITGLAGFVAGGGMGQALIRSKDVSERDYQVVFTAQLCIGAGLFVLLFFFAPVLTWIYGDPLFGELLQVSAVSFLFRPLGNIPAARLNRDMRFAALATANVSALLFFGIFAGVMATQGLGPWALILGGLVSSLPHYVLLRSLARWTPALRTDRDILRRHGWVGIKFSLNDILYYARSKAPELIIGRFAGTAALGYFTRGDSLSRMPFTLISGSLYGPLFRGLSAEQSNLDRSAWLYRRSILLVTTYTLPLTAVLAWIAPEFIAIVYGHKWAPAASILQALALIIPVRIVAHISGAVVAAQDRLGEEARIQFFGLLLVIVGTAIGIQWGIPGAIAAIGLTSLYLAVAICSLACDALQLRPSTLISALLPGLIFAFASLISMIALGALTPPPSAPTLWADVLRMLLSVSVGIIVPAVLFVLVPFRALREERSAWLRLRPLH